MPITLAIKAQTAMQEARAKIMEAKQIQLIKQTYDNYMQTKNYYEEIRAASRNRGGLLGYYTDKFMNRFNDAKYEEYREIQKLKEGDSDNDIRKLVETSEKYVNNKIEKEADKMIAEMKKELDAMVKMLNHEDEKAKMREKTVKDLFADAGKPGMTDKKKDSLELQIAMAQLEYLASLDRYNRMLYAETIAGQEKKLKEMIRSREIDIKFNNLNLTEPKYEPVGKSLTRQELIKELELLPGGRK